MYNHFFFLLSLFTLCEIYADSSATLKEDESSFSKAHQSIVTESRKKVPPPRPSVTYKKIETLKTPIEENLVPSFSDAEKEKIAQKLKKNNDEFKKIDDEFLKMPKKKQIDVVFLASFQESDQKKLNELEQKSSLTKSEKNRLSEIKSLENKRKKYKKELDLYARQNELEALISPVKDEALKQHIEANTKDLNKIISDQEKKKTEVKKKIDNLDKVQEGKKKELTEMLERITGKSDLEIKNRKALIQLANNLLKEDSLTRMTAQEYDDYRQKIGHTYHIFNYKPTKSPTSGTTLENR